MIYQDTLLFIAGQWRQGQDSAWIDVLNPATNGAIGKVAVASPADIEEAAGAAGSAFRAWRQTPAYDRARIIRKGAGLLRDRVESIATALTMEQGKRLEESRIEVLHSADILDWFAGEAAHIHGRIIPARLAGTEQRVVKQPIGPVAAFTPWNFPLSQTARKLGAALAAGCTVVLKAAEDTPHAPSLMVAALAEAGLPPGVLNLVHGDPAEISDTLIRHKAIRKVSFTGSTPVGKKLASLAGQYMKPVTMELGGHAPVLVFKDADIGRTAQLLAQSKYRNSGQVCVSPTRFVIEHDVFEQFTEAFLGHVASISVGDGLDPATVMGPVVNARRLDAMTQLVEDARAKGATVRAGGERIGNQGNFFAPTVLTEVSLDARVMNDEPFGPLATLAPFASFDDAIAEANRLDYGLAAYAFTGSETTARRVAGEIEAGMLAINGARLGLPETPFGGIKDSGFGTEGGPEAVEAYLTTRFVTQTGFP